MKIPLGFLEKKEKVEYYLALVLQNEKVNSVIFEKQGQALKYISSDEEYFKNTIEDATEIEFLDILDKVITTAETALPESIETHKTLFGLKDNWIENDKIKKEYLEKLKKAGDELALEPIGFLAFSESLINLIQKEEGAPLTSVLVNVGKKHITVYWIKGGKILETKTSEIHDSPSFTTDALMKHFQSGGSLPSKIIIFNSDEEELTQEFIGHQWSKSLSFLHIPQVESLPQDAAAKAMLLGAATQMGTQLVYDYSKNLETEVEEEMTHDEEQKSEETQKGMPEERKTEETEGFEEPAITKPVGEVTEATAEFFGFVEGKDVTETAPSKISLDKDVPSQITEESIEEIPDEIKTEEEKKIPLPINIGFVSEKIKTVLPKAFNLVDKIKINRQFLSSLKSGNKLLLIIPLILVLLVFWILYVYLFQTSVQINVYVNPKQEQKTTPVTFSNATDITNKTIAFETVSVTETGSVSTNTTGKKNVGQAAKGTVTIFNNSNSVMDFPQGTTITSSNNLNYTTDKEVTVASASGDVFSGTTPGTAGVTVTAADIGQDYNLPSGTKFSIGTNPDVAAKNDSAFSGGSSKSVVVVSSDDLNKLLTDLPKSLEQKAKQDLQAKSTPDRTVIGQFISETVSNKDFSNKEGDQVSTVGLNGTVTFDAISYLNSDMDNLANSLFASDERIMSNDLTVNAANIKQQANQDITAEITINAGLMPKIDIDSLRKQIAGFSKTKATNTLDNLVQAQRVQFNFNPGIPLLPQNLPEDYRKIFINITTK